MYGLAGQISAANRLAPDDADEDDIARAAYLAFEEGRDARETLEEVMGNG